MSAGFMKVAVTDEQEVASGIFFARNELELAVMGIERGHLSATSGLFSMVTSAATGDVCQLDVGST